MSEENTGMKCEDCGKEAGTIIHYQGKDRCLKCDEDYQNKMKTNSQRKKDENSLLGNHLESRSNTGEDNTRENMPVDMDNHADI